MKPGICAYLLMLAIGVSSCSGKIDRQAVVTRNNPHVTAIDTLASLSVGNGEFAFTADVTGLQTWPELYSAGVPLGTMAQWGWHSFPGADTVAFEDCLRGFDFGRGRAELYACQGGSATVKAAANVLRANPHRLHLGCIGFKDIRPEEVEGIDQTLDLWRGILHSVFRHNGAVVQVETFADPSLDAVCAMIDSPERLALAIRFPYPTGKHSDDACDWNACDRHSTSVVGSDGAVTVLERVLDGTKYYVSVRLDGATAGECRDNEFTVVPQRRKWSLSVRFSAENDGVTAVPETSRKATVKYWKDYWENGGFVDFGHCADPRAAELERRVILSQYLLAVQCAGSTPPQETGLTYNSWFGKFHLEMIWWHQAHFALWGRPQMIERTLPWYHEAEPVAREIACRQGFGGVRWMKMTDPSALEAPSDVGSFLIWQQPHLIYLAELLRRAGRDVDGYAELVDETAEFMAQYAWREADGRFVLKGCIPAQETMKAEKTVNPPLELAYWRFGLETAQQWRERRGLERNPEWDEVLAGLSPLASKDGLYLSAESEPDTYLELGSKLTSDHMAVLGACGMVPPPEDMSVEMMKRTLNWVISYWNWDHTWGWDYPLSCMCAVRLGEPEKALDLLLLDRPKNSYLVNGHNWQDDRLRCYLPGNGGLLSAVAMMCAGYDGCTGRNPGFPAEGWDVRWEGLSPMP